MILSSYIKTPRHFGLVCLLLLPLSRGAKALSYCLLKGPCSMERFQKTIGERVVFTDKGLHSGRIVRLEVQPAAANTGIIFQRTDVEAALPVAAHVRNISSTDLCTTIGHGSQSIATIEHLMAAFAGLGIDNAYVFINGPEVPIMDGSAEPFVKAFMDVGLKVLSADRKFYALREAFEFRRGDQYLIATPSYRPKVKCSIEFSRSIIGFQSFEYRPSPENFLKVADARTFCHLNDVNLMREQGLALGGSLDNAVVVTDSSILNAGGLRGSNEFVRHKLLDMIGDLSLLGHVLLADITAHKPGHTLQAQFMRELWSRRDELLELVTLSPKHLDVTVPAPQPVFAFG